MIYNIFNKLHLKDGFPQKLPTTGLYTVSYEGDKLRYFLDNSGTFRLVTYDVMNITKQRISPVCG